MTPDDAVPTALSITLPVQDAAAPTPSTATTGTTPLTDPLVGPADGLAPLIDQWVSGCLAALYAQALREQARYEAAVAAAILDRPETQRARLTLTIRLSNAPRATPGFFSIEWATYRASRCSGGRPRRFSRYLLKGAGHQYRASTFSGIVPAWQRPLVLAAEEHFARIRAEASLVAEVRTRYRVAVKALAEVAAWRNAEPDRDNASPANQVG